MTGEAELLCVPCYSRDTARKECLLLTAQRFKTWSATTLPEGDLREPNEKRVKEETLSVVLIGSATASSIFLIVLLLWLFLLTAERFKQVSELCSDPEGLLSAANLQYTPSIHTERAPTDPTAASVSAEDSIRGPSHESDMHPTSIVINVTTNIKPSSQNKDTQEEEQSLTREEMEQKLQTIWEIAQDQSIDMLDYDSVQDLSLLLDSAENIHVLQRLGRSLGVPPQVIAHLRGFQDLFQYLRTSTYTLLPQLAQAAALLPSSEIVARIHRAVVNK
ncbi:uncharacterized protein LOC114442429 isoform X1 [Parambassis ranga]|uniref:Uncharacterized protein LOC114442429 isoform X1 n=1 Tax=Parambassis ranga TaxID=210632 RepID=A0A6P7J5R7_9TELE|nr:uncharacterized protein LOC114442429 isoform X1 [Parambassis ranga]